MQTTGPVHKGVYILPNLFTTASLFTGFLGLILAAEGRIELCAAAILFSAVMDGLDGKVARLTNSASEFGVQYDSLADLVAFGVAPAFMLYMWQLQTFPHMGLAAAFLFAACGALRLARFNITTSGAPKNFSVGLTITMSGCTLATLVLFIPYTPDFFQHVLPGFCLGLTLCLAYLMVSRIRFPTLKEFGFITARPFSSMVSAILLFALVISAPKLLGFLLFAAYIVSGLVYTFVVLPRRARLTLPVTKTL